MAVGAVLAVVQAVASIAAEIDRQAEVDQKFSQVLSEVGLLWGLVEELRDVVREEITRNEIYDIYGQIEFARRISEDGEFQRAAAECNRITSRLQQEDLLIQGAFAYELAAAMHISMLRKLNDSDALKRYCLLYADQLRRVIALIRKGAAQRIRSYQPVTPNVGFTHFYAIDGVDVAKKMFIPGFPNRRKYDIERLAAELTISLSSAAESWQAVAEERLPDYGDIFNGPDAGISGPMIWAEGKPASLAVSATDGQVYRLLFNSDAWTDFTSYSVQVAVEIYHDGIDRFYDLKTGSDVFTAPERPAAVIAHMTTGDRSEALFPFSSDALIDRLGSPVKAISQAEYDQMISSLGKGVHLRALDKILEGNTL